MQLKRVVVTGLGALTPIGNNIEQYWNALINGVSGAAPITYFDAAKFKTRFACELQDLQQLTYRQEEARKWYIPICLVLRQHLMRYIENSIRLVLGQIVFNSNE